MKRVVRYVDEDTLEIKEVMVEETNEQVLEAIKKEKEKEETKELNDEKVLKLFNDALGCEPEDFQKKYVAYKKAEKEFLEICDPFKANLIKLHEDYPELPKAVVVGSTKFTYVSPSTRTTIDSKKLKEEEPALAEKYKKVSNVKASIRLEDTVFKM